MSDIIAAAATPAAKSALAVVRVSGAGCIEMCDRLFFPAGKKSASSCEHSKSVYGTLRREDGSAIDTCLAVFCRAPKSYTGEDTAEFSCHGSPAAVSSLLSSLFRLGARQAQPGEFTKRAFLNGKLDLTAAEAIVDLVDAETEAAVKNAAAQLTGAMSARLKEIYILLIQLPSHFSALVDFPEDDVEPQEISDILAVIDRAKAGLRALSASAERGRIIRDGIRAAIIGRPNAGKSSLLNALLGWDRAIVSPLAGTTRDTIEEKLILGGVLLRLSDTAGLRETSDETELEGVSRAISAARDAELVLCVFDGSAVPGPEDEAAAEAALAAPYQIAIVNKSDLPAACHTPPHAERMKKLVRVCALTGDGLSELDAAVAELFTDPLPAAGLTAAITNARQAAAVNAALAALERASDALLSGVTPDAVLLDIEEALICTGQVTGDTLRGDVVENIFSRFCVGK